MRKEMIERMAAAGVPDPATDFRRLFDWAYGKGCDAPQTRDAPNAVTLQALEAAIIQRAARVPVSHIIGKRAFWRSDFRVTPDVLDPRPETELLIELALREPFKRVLDLGTGSGCILISLLLDQPDARGVGTDISEKAVLIAGENAAALGVADRLVLPLSDWFDDVGGRFDLIVSNPPYIALAEMEDLSPEVRKHEPQDALTDGKDGLTAYRIIADHALNHLIPGGRILVEIGASQAANVKNLFRDAGLVDIQTHPDLDGRDRVIAAKAPI